jgi:UDP-N-acetylglucosamine--N-acetylmuramyl-(pentapeptide) pyrophosphoryl-undecaprenol N-acetylglucosamine transferase
MPAVIVPWPGATNDHQHGNARLLGDAAAAVVLAERDLTAASLAELVGGFASDHDRLAAMAEQAYAAGAVHRSGRLAAAIESAAANR